MRSARDILIDLGFRPDAPESTKRAFLKHLQRDADLVNPRDRTPPSEPPVEPEQLSFDPDVLKAGLK